MVKAGASAVDVWTYNTRVLTALIDVASTQALVNAGATLTLDVGALGWTKAFFTIIGQAPSPTNAGVSCTVLTDTVCTIRNDSGVNWNLGICALRVR